jgi:crotonobetainyl-CoA:carnitine CoA-transferase CaiB-like acyl-CoA transferase
MTSITPFGQEGPYKDWKASDIVISAMGGMQYVLGDPDRPPIRLGGGEHSHAVACTDAAAATMIAHYYRELTGQGQYVDISAQEGMAFASMIHFTYWDYKDTGQEYFKEFNLERLGSQVVRWRLMTRQVWECKDGYIKWQLRTGRWAPHTYAVVNWMDREGEAGELKGIKWEEYGLQDLNPGDFERWQNMFAEFFKKHTQEEYERELEANSISYFPMRSPKDILNSPQLAAREYWLRIEYPELDATIVHPGAIYKSSEIEWRTPRRSPILCEHNREIYQRELGFSDEELCRLKEGNVI